MSCQVISERDGRAIYCCIMILVSTISIFHYISYCVIKTSHSEVLTAVPSSVFSPHFMPTQVLVSISDEIRYFLNSQPAALRKVYRNRDTIDLDDLCKMVDDHNRRVVEREMRSQVCRDGILRFIMISVALSYWLTS